MKTPLYDSHRGSNANMVDFFNWQLPIHYGSQLQEHHVVRQHAGMFDVSHMRIVDFTGSDTLAWLRYLLANDVSRLSPGKALYSCLLNHEGGILDDCLVYYLADNHYRIVFNAATEAVVLPWCQQQLKGDVTMSPVSDRAMLAVQGPLARQLSLEVMPDSLKDKAQALTKFSCLCADDWFVARTGYTGEDGFEIALPAEQAGAFWDKLLSVGVKPCGLGARDTLRLEAGLNLYGQDMTESVTPLEANLAWTVVWRDEDFIGRQALLEQRERGLAKKLVGLVLQAKGGILRHGQSIYQNDELCGVITSGTFSPTLQRSVAMASIQHDVVGECSVAIRKNRHPALVTRLPFYRQGKILIEENDA